MHELKGYWKLAMSNQCNSKGSEGWVLWCEEIDLPMSRMVPVNRWKLTNMFIYGIALLDVHVLLLQVAFASIQFSYISTYQSHIQKLKLKSTKAVGIYLGCRNWRRGSHHSSALDLPSVPASSPDLRSIGKVPTSLLILMNLFIWTVAVPRTQGIQATYMVPSLYELSGPNSGGTCWNTQPCHFHLSEQSKATSCTQVSKKGNKAITMQKKKNT